jgi:hypothetical protein
MRGEGCRWWGIQIKIDIGIGFGFQEYCNINLMQRTSINNLVQKKATFKKNLPPSQKKCRFTQKAAEFELSEYLIRDSEYQLMIKMRNPPTQISVEATTQVELDNLQAAVDQTVGPTTYGKLKNFVRVGAITDPLAIHVRGKIY